MAAFEAITTRKSWYAGEKLSAYTGVQYGTAGKFVKADGTRPFAGIVQYGCDAADEMVTVVDGMFPAVASVAVTAGAIIAIDTANPGKFKLAGASTAVCGIAMTDAGAGETFTLAMLPVTFTTAAG